MNFNEGWVGGSQTDGCNEVDDDEGVEHGDNGRADCCYDVAQAFETPKEAEDSESPKHLGQEIGNVGVECMSTVTD